MERVELTRPRNTSPLVIGDENVFEVGCCK